MSNVYVFDHPLIQHKTAMIRKEDTSVKDFRELVREISMLMGYEATRKLPLEEVEITTPICDTKVNMLKGEDIAIVPILRAGLGMVDGMLALVPNAKVGHVGLYRDPETHEPFSGMMILKNQESIRVLCLKGSYEAFPFLTAFFFIHIKQQLPVAGSGLVLQCHSLQKNQSCAALCVAVVPHLHILRKVTALRGVCTFHRQYGKSVFRCQPANLQRTP